MKDDTLSVVQFTSAKRSKVAFAYHLIDRGYIRRQTNNLEFGWHKYNPEGTGASAATDGNWRAGVDKLDIPFLLDVLNHLEEHVASLTESVLSMLAGGALLQLNEDDIAHASFNLMILSRFMDQRGFDAEYWRPIYQRRLEEWRQSQEKK